MPVYHVKCYETVNFTVAIEAESEEEARELAHADINSHEVIAESTTDWDIDEIILEDEEWYNKSFTRVFPPTIQSIKELFSINFLTINNCTSF